jgi:hypothetical protein
MPGTPREYGFSFASDLHASPEAVWSHAADMRGVNREFFPLVRMTCPVPDGRLLSSPPLGQRLFRSWILLFCAALAEAVGPRADPHPHRDGVLAHGLGPVHPEVAPARSTAPRCLPAGLPLEASQPAAVVLSRSGAVGLSRLSGPVRASRQVGRARSTTLVPARLLPP